MSNVKPLTLSQDGLAQLQQLQGRDDLDIPLRDQVLDLERRFRLLLADYVQKLGPVAALGDENGTAQSVGI